MRALTARERGILEAMLANAEADPDDRVTADDRHRWLSALDETHAGRACGCGSCPSIELTDAAGASPEGWQSRVVLEAAAPGGLILLFIDDDAPSYLEFAPHEEGPVSEFPDVQDLSFSR